MLGAVVAQIVTAELAEHHAVLAEQAGILHLPFGRPARCAVGLGELGFTGSPDRHGDGDDDGDQPTGRGDDSAVEEDAWRVGVVAQPPPEEGERRIDPPAGEQEPGMAELGLEGQRGRGPLGCAPDGGEHGQEDDEDCAPKDFTG